MLIDSRTQISLNVRSLRFFPKVFEFINASQENMSFSSSDGIFGSQEEVHTAGSSAGDYQAPDLGDKDDDDDSADVVAEL